MPPLDRRGRCESRYERRKLLNEFNMSEGTAWIAVPTACNIPHSMEVPISHLRPYVTSLDGKAWHADNPADVDHIDMVRCSEPTCNRPATHNDGSHEHEYMCCSGHCTCSDKYTDTHISSNSDDCEVTVGTGPLDREIAVPDDVLESFWNSKVVTDSVLDSLVNDVIENEINLSERKLRLYWDRVSDLPDKVKGGIEVIRFDADTPKDVLKWVQGQSRTFTTSV